MTHVAKETVPVQVAHEDRASVAPGPAADEAFHLICPVTGLPVLRRAGWQQVTIEAGFRISAEIIGGAILLTRKPGAGHPRGGPQGLRFHRGADRGGDR